MYNNILLKIAWFCVFIFAIYTGFYIFDKINIKTISVGDSEQTYITCQDFTVLSYSEDSQYAYLHKVELSYKNVSLVSVVY